VARDKQNADEALLLALACGATVENAARTAGMSARTAHRRLADPAFQRRLQDLRTAMIQRAVGMLTAAALEAVKTLIALQDLSVPAAVRLGAARTVLEFGIRMRENAELAQRIAALEAQVGSAPPVAAPP
jgi:hypothetical protein